jgi:signal transduction histidine kinase
VFQASFLRTSSFRLALLYTALFLASVLILFAVTYWSAASYAAQDETNEIAAEYAAIQDEAKLTGDNRLPTIVENHSRVRKDVRAVYLLEDAKGRKLAGNIGPLTRRVGPSMLRVPLDGRLRDVRAYGYRLADGGYLLIGQDTFALRELEEVIARAFSVGLVATLLLAVIGGAIVSATVLRRVESVSRTARAIVGGDLGQRVPVRGTHDEFDTLAASVNAMLDRIEDLMRSMRQVSNDIAHDLRTPLTRLRHGLERARGRGLSVEQLEAILGASITQIDSILETFAALLRIAQIEAGDSRLPARPFDVSSVLSSVVEDFSPAAEDHGHQITADIESGVTVLGDRELFIQMVVNLLDNAIRHTPRGAQISVQAKACGAEFEVAVSDTGHGIPAPEREQVLRPFYRLEASRTTEGNGLGLSLVAAIAKWHHAVLTLSDNHPGLRVALRFPAPA